MFFIKTFLHPLNLQKVSALGCVLSSPLQWACVKLLSLFIFDGLRQQTKKKVCGSKSLSNQTSNYINLASVRFTATVGVTVFTMSGLGAGSLN